MDFFEISPNSVRFAGPEGRSFGMVAHSQATVRTVLGDGRLTLKEHQSSGAAAYDVLVMDAFTSGSIPWHLLTRESFDLFLSTLAPDGVLVVHVSNLLPIHRLVLRLAQEAGLPALYLDVRPPDARATLEFPSKWVCMARKPESLSGIQAGSQVRATLGVAGPDSPEERLGQQLVAGIRPWSDGYNSSVGLVWDALRHPLPVGEERRQRVASTF